MADTDTTCEMCRNARAAMRCSGCQMALCQACSHFELVGSGCGTIYPLYYCVRCVYDERINPNAVFKEK